MFDLAGMILHLILLCLKTCHSDCTLKSRQIRNRPTLRAVMPGPLNALTINAARHLPGQSSHFEHEHKFLASKQIFVHRELGQCSLWLMPDTKHVLHPACSSMHVTDQPRQAQHLISSCLLAGLRLSVVSLLQLPLAGLL